VDVEFRTSDETAIPVVFTDSATGLRAMQLAKDTTVSNITLKVRCDGMSDHVL
jgi:hypothetical protein